MSGLDQWFWIILNIGLFVACMLLLDAAHRSRIAELKGWHEAELSGMRTYIRTLNRERKWLEAELAKTKAALAQRHDNPFDPFAGVSEAAVQKWLPPSEEYDERD